MTATRPFVIAASACVMILASCGSEDNADPDTAAIGAQLSDSPGELDVAHAPEVPTDQLPPGAEPTWSLELDSSPHITENRLVSLVYPDSNEAELSIVGLDPTGTLRWRITTNPSCAGFGITRHEGRDLVIVLDSDADVAAGELATRTTATAFDTDDGSVAWGPVDVPGPLRGPGLIFGEAPGSVVAEESGPRVMLSVADGSVVADETEDDTVYYEHHGVGVFERDGVLQARDTATGDSLWTSDELAQPAGTDPSGGPTPVTQTTASVANTMVLAWPAASSGTIYTAHDLETGALLDQLPGEPDGASVSDPDSKTTLITTSSSAGRHLTALQHAGIRWTQPFPDDAAVDVIAGGAAYGRNGTDGMAVNLTDGTTRNEGPWTPPAARMPAGPAFIQLPGAGRQRYVAVSLPE